MKFDPSIVQARCASPLGPMLLAATNRGLAGIWFEQQRHFPDSHSWPQAPQHPVLQAAMRQLSEYFAGERMTFNLPLDLQGGTPFQQSVWRALLAIPRGKTISYRTLSERTGFPTATRAVGAAVGRNPLTIVVPCHRVVGADGSLTGYAGGLERKRALLRLEGAA
ncbi:MAG TPA: methylated-DNA--[protein]-cysteine S-methyltransferase [Ramlibacter sp.]|nr:methylated-DNA--[protein]-cysteine S-methyltransferase [Ramlibacter sp.]